jgi:transcriptional regulator with XRE-family HTH domain
MTNISVQLKTLREKNKITQSEMAKILGVKERGAVSLYESGKRKLTLVQYFKLIDHFGESAYEAFEIKNQKPNTSQMLEEEGVMYITQASELKSKYIACLEEKEKLRQRISELEAKK